MIWFHHDTAWEEGLTAAQGWAKEHGHLLAPLDATYQGARVGMWLKSARAAARKAAEIEQRHAEGLPVPSSAGTLSEDRREQLEDIDPLVGRARGARRTLIPRRPKENAATGALSSGRTEGAPSVDVRES
ncbi:helicase associated domain-containing protein [Streptomyces sp. NPDC001978]|uniref:helicase associated domain-containing protein n=1 Tax=Streptomyces sp. NPDC001978 TaxID=3364627 RepID=UPI0036CA87B4